VVAYILADVCVCSAESAKSCYYDSIATVGVADMKLGRCVVGTKMQFEFKDGCGMSTPCILGSQFVSFVIRMFTCDITAGVLPPQMASPQLLVDKFIFFCLIIFFCMLLTLL